MCLGCATSTSIVSVGDESYKGVEYERIVVSAPYEDLQIRSYVESLFERTLTNVNIKVLRAMDVLPPFKTYTLDEFQYAMTDNSVQCLLVVAVTDFWVTSVSTPGKYVSESKSWSNLFGVQFSETETRYVRGFTLDQSNVKLDVRMFALSSEGVPLPIWRANSTTSGNYFTPNSKVMSDAARQTAKDLRAYGIIKSVIDLSSVCPNEVDDGFSRLAVTENLIILGGFNYSNILGCLSCGDDAPQSPFNENGYFGTNSEHTFWKPCGNYASKNSDYSACNRDAKFPPILVNASGEKIGILSIARKHKSNFSDWRKLRSWLKKEICIECTEDE